MPRVGKTTFSISSDCRYNTTDVWGGGGGLITAMIVGARQLFLEGKDINFSDYVVHCMLLLAQNDG